MEYFISPFVELFFFFILCLIIPVIIIFLSKSYHYFITPLKNTQKKTSYECGFHQVTDSRNVFDVHFVITGILFLLFDIEIIFLFPWALTFREIGIIGILSGLCFIYILIIGFIYEWKRGALTWFFFKK